MKVAQVLVLAFAISPSLALAQSPASPPIKPVAPTTLHTFFLKNAANVNDINEVLTTVRNMLPQNVRIYSVGSQNAIFVEATDEQIHVAQRIIDELDRPRKSYRITYTVTEVDGTKRLSAQHVAMNLVSGQTSVIKQGSRIPVITTSSDPANPTTQYAYIDVGLNIATTVTGVEGGANLKTKVEQSSIASERSSASIPDPNIRQTTLESVSLLTNGKPSVLGSLDLPGTTHHFEIEALLETTP